MRLHRVLTRALLASGATVLALSMGWRPAAAQTSGVDPFQPKPQAGATPAASPGPSSAAAAQPSVVVGAPAPSASAITAGITPAAATPAAMPTTGVQATRAVLIGLICLTLGLALVLGARPPRLAPAPDWHLAGTRHR